MKITLVMGVYSCESHDIIKAFDTFEKAQKYAVDCKFDRVPDMVNHPYEDFYTKDIEVE